MPEWTPLDFAIACEAAPLVERLLRAGAEPGPLTPRLAATLALEGGHANGTAAAAIRQLLRPPAPLLEPSLNYHRHGHQVCDAAACGARPHQPRG